MKIKYKKRRRQGKTNYSKRKRLLEMKRPRIIVRKTNRYIILQYVKSSAAKDKILHTINSKELLKYGWPKEKSGSLKSLGAAYLAGLLFGKKIKDEEEAILDTGLITSTKGSRIYSSLKGIVDSGVKIRHNAKMFPSEERIKTEKVKDFFDDIKTKISEVK